MISYTQLYIGDDFPAETDSFDFLIIMGGPQSPSTTVDECSYFDIEKETDFIKKAIKAKKLLLGVCLGAQLIGEAMGAKYEHSPNKEIGVFDTELTDAGKNDSVTSVLPERFLVGHWHSDMPGLTADSEILAKSEGCPRQIVKYADGIYGFQCHFEFNQSAISEMIKSCETDLAEYAKLPYIQTKEQLLTYDYHHMNMLLFKCLDKLVELYFVKT